MFSYRAYAQSVWCMREFREAHAHASGNNRNKFLIPILRGDVGLGECCIELRMYLENHTYLESEDVVNFTLLQIMFTISFNSNSTFSWKLF